MLEFFCHIRLLSLTVIMVISVTGVVLYISPELIVVIHHVNGLEKWHNYDRDDTSL